MEEREQDSIRESKRQGGKGRDAAKQTETPARREKQTDTTHGHTGRGIPGRRHVNDGPASE
eukprot:1778030-Rhodomonas_salina.1